MMFGKLKNLLSLFIGVTMLLCTAMPTVSFAASVTFNENTEYYATIDTAANTEKNDLQIQTNKSSYLFSTNYNSQLLKKIKNDGVTDLTEDEFTAVHFVDLADYDLTDITYSDYSASGDESVKAWVNGTELYIGGYGKIIAGRSLSCALRDGKKIDRITGLDLLDTSKTTDMGYLFNYCGSESTVFTLDLGDNFDTSKVTDMTYMFLYCGKNSTKFELNLGDKFDTSNVTKMGSMFYGCGYSSPTFTLDLGDKFDTSKVTYMYQMFQYCGMNSKAFTTLDLSSFTIGANTTIDWFADNIPVTKFIFGKGWRNAALPVQYTYFARRSSDTPTEIVGATKNLLSYDWTRDKRTVTFTDNTAYTITPAAENGGTVSGGGTVLDGESITLTASANEGYTFDGWYDGDTKVCETEEFVIEDAADNKTYTAKFAKNAISYTITAEAGTEGGTVSGGGTVLDGGSMTLTATANEGYTFDGWYDGDTKVCETEEFVVSNVTEDKTYTAKFTENVQKISRLYSTKIFNSFLEKAGNLGVVKSDIKNVAFVDINNYDLTGVTTEDYSADGDNSVLAWFEGSTLYIGGYGKIIAGDSLSFAFYNFLYAESITGLELLDTSMTTDMQYMFSGCGSRSTEFTLDLGSNFDTSNVENMSMMFESCGYKSKNFSLNLGNKFNTSKVTDMSYMFSYCGRDSEDLTLNLGDLFDTSNVTTMSRMFQGFGENSQNLKLNLGNKFNTSNVTNMSNMFACFGKNCPTLKTLDFSTFLIGNKTSLSSFAANTSVTTFIFGKGWENAYLWKSGTAFGPFLTDNTQIDTTVIGATNNLIRYNWAADNRTVTFPDKNYYMITANTTDGGTASGGNSVVEGGSITLTAAANDGYTFAGWYDGDTKVCDTAEFVVSNVTEDKTYTAKFAKNAVSYTITAEAGTEGGTVSGGGTVAEGGSITLTAAADDGYTFDGWYDGDTKVCDTAEFIVENVTADKTYTAKFTKNQAVDPDPEPSDFDFTSLRTLKTKNITVNHETKTIDIDAADNTDYITIFVHQKDVIPGGTFKMASYLGNKVVYDKNGSYRVYYVHNFTVPVKGNITVNGVTEQYLVNVHFDSSKAGFDFTSLKGENFSDVTVNHDDKTVHITANDSADEITLYVNQHDTVYGGKLRMASYLGNKVNYNGASGVYTIYANGKSSVSVKANIAINGTTEQYLITVDFPAVSWGFEAVNAENVKNVSIDHENKVITIDTTEGADSILLYIDQTCGSGIKGQIWMKSYMGNKVVYNAADRTYTITKKDKNSITVKTKITMLGETRYYDININFAENE